jgi:ligand-binding sensor domain-containing protein
MASAQEKPGVIFQRYDKSDGLSSNSIKNITQDKEGFIWIASGNSLQRYDGHHFRTYTTENEPNLLSNDIFNVYCDSQNRLWIYYRFRGIGLWDLNTGEKQNFTPQLNDKTSLPDHRVFEFYEDKQGTIWLSIHRKGIARFNERTEDFELFVIDGIVHESEKRGINTSRTLRDHPSNDDELFIGTFNGLLVLNKITKAVRKLPIGKNNSENPDQYNGYEDVILDIYLQDEATLWIATFGGGVLKYNLNTGTFRSIKLDAPFPANPTKNNFHQIANRDENSLWISIWSKGLYILDLETEKLTMVNQKADGLSEMPGALKLLKGKYGHLWLSSNQGLIKIYLEKGFKNYQYLGYAIEDLEFNQQTKQYVVLPRTSDHVNIYNKTWNFIRRVKYQPERPFDLNFLEGLHYYNGKFYLQGFEGLYQLNSELTQIKPIQPFFDQLNESERLSIISSYIDSRGNIWMGTKVKGIFRYHIPSEKLYHYSSELTGSQPHTNRWIFDIYEDKNGKIWFGTEAGFCYFNPVTQAFSNFPYPENSKEIDNLYFKEIVGFAEQANGNIWIGSRESGLGLFESKDLSRPLYMVESRDRLRNQLLENVLDKNQKLYLNLNEGLAVLAKQTRKLDVFTKAFGVNQIQNITKKGDLVIGDGFADPSSFDYNDLPQPKIHVDDLIIAGHRKVYDGSDIKIPFSKNSISLRIGILDFVEKERANLEYRLSTSEGSSWTNANANQLLSFPYLDHGTYTLKLRAISPNGEIWDSMDIPIEIAPLFWQRLWVQVLFILIVITLISLPIIYKNYQKRQREQLKLAYEKEIYNLKRKALKAQINPHFLFNSLNSIRLLVLKGNTDKASEGISTFSKLVRKILRHSERDFISLKEEIESAQEYIKLEQMRFKEPFDFEVIVEDGIELESIDIPPMLIQPFLENSIWHGLRYKSDQGRLSISISKDINTEDFVVSIQDNGVGREASAKLSSGTKKSFGIKISSERLKNFNRSNIDGIQIHDLKNDEGQAEGTLVEIRIKSK